MDKNEAETLEERSYFSGRWLDVNDVTPVASKNSVIGVSDTVLVIIKSRYDNSVGLYTGFYYPELAIWYINVPYDLAVSDRIKGKMYYDDVLFWLPIPELPNNHEETGIRVVEEICCHKMKGG